MTVTGDNSIAGEWAAGTGTSFHAQDPATGAALMPVFREAAPSQVDRAVQAAADAFEPYRALAPERRARLLDAIALQLETGAEPLLARCQQETGLPAPRLKGELARTCGQLRMFSALVRDGSWADIRVEPALPDRQPLPRPDLRRMLIPLGPVAVFGASNFPLAFSTAGGDTASALAAGCPVLVKAHPAHPGTAEAVARAIARAVQDEKMPPGIFSLLHGGPDLGLALVRHPALCAVGFTGSHRAGRALFDAAAARPRPIPVFAEMSGVNPLIILPGALHEREPAIAEGLAASATLGSGQFCTKPGLILLPAGERSDAFLARLAKLFDASAPMTLLTGAIQRGFLAGRERVLADPQVMERGREKPAAESGARTTVQASFAITTADAFRRQPSLAEEVFGPFALVVTYRSEEELTACLTQLDGQLTATVHAAESDICAGGAAWLPLLERKAGRLIFNGFPTGVEVSPAMNHGGPYPATSDARFTSVGTAAILRFVRPICYQNFPTAWLPEPLKPAAR